MLDSLTNFKSVSFFFFSKKQLVKGVTSYSISIFTPLTLNFFR